jgi:hypothetical protein
MGIAASELCRYVIRPTLICTWGTDKPDAEALLLGIAASQSHLGSALHDRRGHGLYCITRVTPCRPVGSVPGPRPGFGEPGARPGQPACVPQQPSAGTDGQPALRHRHRLVFGRATTNSHSCRPDDLLGMAQYLERKPFTHMGVCVISPKPGAPVFHLSTKLLEMIGQLCKIRQTAEILVGLSYKTALSPAITAYSASTKMYGYFPSAVITPEF